MSDVGSFTIGLVQDGDRWLWTILQGADSLDAGEAVSGDDALRDARDRLHLHWDLAGESPSCDGAVGSRALRMLAVLVEVARGPDLTPSS